MRRLAAIVLTAATLSACQTTAPRRDLSDYPEGRAVVDCVIAKARLYAPQPDSALELGLIGWNACSTEQLAFERALQRQEGPAYANEVTRLMNQSQPQLIAEFIVDIRAGRRAR